MLSSIYVHVYIYIYIAVACYGSLLKNDTDFWKHFYGVCHHSSATCVTLKCTSEASKLKQSSERPRRSSTNLFILRKSVHSVCMQEAFCVFRRNFLLLRYNSLPSDSLKKSSNLRQSCAFWFSEEVLHFASKLCFLILWRSPPICVKAVLQTCVWICSFSLSSCRWCNFRFMLRMQPRRTGKALFGGRAHDVMFNQETLFGNTMM